MLRTRSGSALGGGISGCEHLDNAETRLRFGALGVVPTAMVTLMMMMMRARTRYRTRNKMTSMI